MCKHQLNWHLLDTRAARQQGRPAWELVKVSTLFCELAVYYFPIKLLLLLLLLYEVAKGGSGGDEEEKGRERRFQDKLTTCLALK